MVNMNIANEIKTGAKSNIGKFRRDLNFFSRDKIKEYDPRLLDLYDWFKSLNSKEINYLLEMKNIYTTLKSTALPAIMARLQNGEVPNKRELETMKLLVDTLDKSHKLKFGDKKVIEHAVTVADLRKQMSSDKRIVKARVMKVGDGEEDD